jgi:hypothetical protein
VPAMRHVALFAEYAEVQGDVTAPVAMEHVEG